MIEDWVNEGREDGREEGRAEGREEGREMANIETAKKMLLLGKLSHEEIAVYTSLSIEDIEKLSGLQPDKHHKRTDSSAAGHCPVACFGKASAAVS